MEARAHRYTFGDVELDATSRRLLRNGHAVPLASRHFDVLLLLVSRAGTIVSKETLIDAAWRDVAVTENSLEQAISAIRRALGAGPSGDWFIDTVPRQGYRFSGAVTMVPWRASDGDLDALLAPHRAWTEGRAALESLERPQILHAREIFEHLIAQAPDHAPAHVGLANACIMQFELTRADRVPDDEARTRAEWHAREACRLQPEYGEAWATLAFVFHRLGRRTDAQAAARHAVMLDPDNWRHHLRHAFVAWGQDRLSASRRTLALLPGLAMAHYLAATVYVARGAFDMAMRELTAGIDAQARRAADGPRYSAVALHWLAGLVSYARGDEPRALAMFERELEAESSGHLYARECAANTRYAIGAIHLHAGRVGQALVAFAEALRRLPGHPMATIGAAAAAGRLADVSPDVLVAMVDTDGRLSPVDIGILRAGLAVLGGSPSDGATIVAAVLAASATDPDGWLIPVEPLLRVTDAMPAWRPVLTRLASRAL